MFEVFNCTTGRTVTFETTERAARDVCARYRDTDYDRVAGYFVMRNDEPVARYEDRASAQRKVDFENMASDCYFFTVRAA